MITERISKEKLDYWKQIWREKSATLKPNRISGKELNDYLQSMYSSEICDDPNFKEIIILNIIEKYGKNGSKPVLQRVLRKKMLMQQQNILLPISTTILSLKRKFRLLRKL